MVAKYGACKVGQYIAGGTCQSLSKATIKMTANNNAYELHITKRRNKVTPL